MNSLAYDGFHKIEIIQGNQGHLREKLLLKSAVAALVVDDRGYVCLVRQYRPALGRHTWEIPAGVLDKKGLTQIDVMFEELEEECDIFQDNILAFREKLEYDMIPGSSDAIITIYEVDYDGVGENKPIINDDVELIQWFSLKDVQKMIKDGEIRDPKTIIACSYNS